MVSNDARHLSTDAGRLAREAGERLARHVRSQRLSGPRPSAFAATRPQAEPGKANQSSKPHPYRQPSRRQCPRAHRTGSTRPISPGAPASVWPITSAASVSPTRRC